MIQINNKIDWFVNKIEQKNPLAISAVIGTILGLALVVTAVAKKGPGPSIKTMVTSNIGNPQTLGTMQKTASLPSKVAPLATQGSNLNYSPGENFTVHPYETYDFMHGDFYGITIRGSNINMNCITGGRGAGNVVVSLPDGSIFRMTGRFAHVSGTIDTFEYISNMSNQPISILIDRSTRTLTITIR